MPNVLLTANDELTVLARQQGVKYWNDLLALVKNLPYGRNANRSDLSLVLKEQKGSCSSKHAFLKAVAERNNINEVQLYLGIYKMSNKNTPKIGNALDTYPIDFVPEAHCYLKINGQPLDATSTHSDFSILKNDILQEIVISPAQVNTFKVEYHKYFLQNWLKKENLALSFKDVWAIREQCIQNLSA